MSQSHLESWTVWIQRGLRFSPRKKIGKFKTISQCNFYENSQRTGQFLWISDQLMISGAAEGPTKSLLLRKEVLCPLIISYLLLSKRTIENKQECSTALRREQFTFSEQVISAEQGIYLGIK